MGRIVIMYFREIVEDLVSGANTRLAHIDRGLSLKREVDLTGEIKSITVRLEPIPKEANFKLLTVKRSFTDPELSGLALEYAYRELLQLMLNVSIFGVDD